MFSDKLPAYGMHLGALSLGKLPSVRPQVPAHHTPSQPAPLRPAPPTLAPPRAGWSPRRAATRVGVGCGGLEPQKGSGRDEPMGCLLTHLLE